MLHLLIKSNFQFPWIINSPNCPDVQVSSSSYRPSHLACPSRISYKYPFKENDIFHINFSITVPVDKSQFNPSITVLGNSTTTSTLGSSEVTKVPMKAASGSVETMAVENLKKKKGFPGEEKGFVEEMRFVSMKLHTKEQSREGEKVAEGREEQSPSTWEPTVDGYLRFLVDSKLIFDTLEMIVEEAAVPYYGELRNTGLERTGALARDLEWFKEQGHAIPQPSTPGLTYSSYLKELSEKDPQAFICHFYNIYFAHSAGGRMIGRKVSEKVLDKKQLEFYKWEGNLSQLLQNVRDKINKIAKAWTREEKDRCLEETEKSFKYPGGILRQIFA